MLASRQLSVAETLAQGGTIPTRLSELGTACRDNDAATAGEWLEAFNRSQGDEVASVYAHEQGGVELALNLG